MVVGEGKPYLGLLAVVNHDRWRAAMHERGLAAEWPASLHASQSKAYALQRVTQLIQSFPGYARIRRIALLSEAWSIENGLLTPTLKVKRAKVLEHFKKDFDELYDGY
jgi:long-chain acyl-CoA synthetase